MIGEKELLTQAEVQDWLGISRQTLARLRKDPEHPIPFLRTGSRKVQFRREAIERWLEERERTEAAGKKKGLRPPRRR